MKGDRKLQGRPGEKIAERTPPSPAPKVKASARQPQGSGRFDIERTPYGKKMK